MFKKSIYSVSRDRLGKEMALSATLQEKMATISQHSSVISRTQTVVDLTSWLAILKVRGGRFNAEEPGSASAATEEAALATSVLVGKEDGARACSFGGECAEEGDDSVSVERPEAALAAGGRGGFSAVHADGVVKTDGSAIVQIR